MLLHYLTYATDSQKNIKSFRLAKAFQIVAFNH